MTSHVFIFFAYSQKSLPEYVRGDISTCMHIILINPCDKFFNKNITQKLDEINLSSVEHLG